MGDLPRGSMNTRRRLVIALGASALTAPFGSFAQSKQAPILIGWLSANSPDFDSNPLASFTNGLVELGWKEGAQFVMEVRSADGRTDQLPFLAGELSAKKPAIIITSSAQATRAASKAAPKTPVVMASGADPVIAGFAASLSHPGGMITGLSNITADVTEKYLELLLAAAPKLKRVGFLGDSNNPTRATLISAAQRSATQYSIEAHFVEVARPEEIESALSRLAKEGSQALVVMSSAFLGNERQRIVKLALARRWPIAAYSRRWTEEGALLSYGVDMSANYRRAAYFVDRILKGAKPGDLPIEQPTRLELVVNAKTAKALGIKIPNSILVRADKVIE
jgi:putative tryptophan/tyrosine transport system substrate-binding protein